MTALSHVSERNVADITTVEAYAVPSSHSYATATHPHLAELGRGHVTRWPMKCGWKWSISLGRSFKSQCSVQPHPFFLPWPSWEPLVSPGPWDGEPRLIHDRHVSGGRSKRGCLEPPRVLCCLLQQHKLTYTDRVSCMFTTKKKKGNIIK